MVQYIWPVPKGTSINQAFGTNPGGVNPVGGHTGTDLGTEIGTPVRAPADGVIEYAQWFTTTNGSDNPLLITLGGGISVVLNCGNDNPTFIFSHLSATDKNPGDQVKQGDVIAYSGNTGPWTTGPHLHFEAIPPGYNINSSTYGRVNPALYCSGYWSSPTNQGSNPTPIQEKDWFDMATKADLRAVINEFLAPIQTSSGPVAVTQFIADGTRAAQKAAEQTGPINRGGKLIALRQEVANTNTKLNGLEPVIVDIAAQTDPAQIAALIPADIAGQVINALSAKLGTK